MNTTSTTKTTINMQIQNKRRDIVSRESFPKEELIRFTVKDDTLIFPSTSYDGRGYYIKRGSVQNALKKGVFQKVMKRNLRPEELKEIEKYE